MLEQILGRVSMFPPSTFRSRIHFLSKRTFEKLCTGSRYISFHFIVKTTSKDRGHVELDHFVARLSMISSNASELV